jgi:hypothetical protein
MAGSRAPAAERVRYRTNGDGDRRRVVVRDGIEGFHVTCTLSCSGCCELGDCMGNAHNYPYDSKAQCHVGSGCDECGYTGKRRLTIWAPFDYAEWAAHVHAVDSEATA